MDEYEIQKLVSIASQITDLMQEYEDFSTSRGHPSPYDHANVPERKRIRLPSGYMRKAEKFRTDYKLSDIISDKEVVNNISYALQMTDFFNLLLNRFNLLSTLNKLIHKNAILNGFSVFEAIIKASARELRTHCCTDQLECANIARCQFYVKYPKYFNKTLKDIQERVGFDLSDVDKDLKELKRIRDNVHIWQAGYNELTSPYYSREWYNRMIQLLRRVKESYPEKVIEFKEKRNAECTRNMRRRVKTEKDGKVC